MSATFLHCRQTNLSGRHCASKSPIPWSEGVGRNEKIWKRISVGSFDIVSLAEMIVCDILCMATLCTLHSMRGGETKEGQEDWLYQVYVYPMCWILNPLVRWRLIRINRIWLARAARPGDSYSRRVRTYCRLSTQSAAYAHIRSLGNISLPSTSYLHIDLV